MIQRDKKGKRKTYSLASDYFAFGIVVYELLCGLSPFTSERARNWGNKHMKKSVSFSKKYLSHI